MSTGPALSSTSAANPAVGSGPASLAEQKRFLPVAGRPAFMSYAPGLTDSFDLALYRDLGFTTLVVDVPWKTEIDYTPADIMIRSAVRLGLGVMVQLHPGEPPDALKLRVDPENADYRAAASAYLHDAGLHFRSTPHLDGLIFENDAEQHVRVDDDGFRTFLGASYQDIHQLNRAWGTSFVAASQITMDGACRLSLEQYDGLSIPCLEVGRYRASVYAHLLQLWLSAVRESDPGHPVVMGRQNLPRSAIQAPPGAAGVVVSAAPPDVLPVDVARRGGQLAAIVAVSSAAAQHVESLTSLLMDSLIHGAGGVAFPSWSEIVSNPALQAQLKVLLHKLASESAHLQAPLPACAVVYEPLSPGIAQGGPDAPFGYMPHPADIEPGALMHTLSRGSAFGFADVLSVDDLDTAPLYRYRVLFLPGCFLLPPASARALARYVSDGGVIVADLGLDLADLNRLEAPWTREMAALFGVPATRPVQFGRYEYPTRPGHNKRELFGGFTWYPLVANPDLFPGLTDGMARSFASRPVPYSGPRAMAPNSQELSVFGLSATSHEGDLIGGVFVRRLGQGSAIFATFRLWSQWAPEGDLFSLFNWGLVGRSATTALTASSGDLSTVRFTPTEGDGFELMQTGQEATVCTVKLQGAPLKLRTGCVIRNLPGDPPSAIAFSFLKPQEPLVCVTEPISVSPQDGTATSVIDEYSPASIRLKICGNGAGVRAADGRLHLVPGESVNATVTIRDGAYALAPGSTHEAVITDLRPGGKVSRVVLTVTPDGTLSFSWRFTASSVEIRRSGG